MPCEPPQYQANGMPIRSPGRVSLHGSPPFARRTIQADGLTIFRIRYWHPLFAAWRETRRSVSVRYHPEDLSRIFVCGEGKNYFEVRYADLRRSSISLFEQRTVLKFVRVQEQRSVSETMIFRAVEGSCGTRWRRPLSGMKGRGGVRRSPRSSVAPLPCGAHRESRARHAAKATNDRT